MPDLSGIDPVPVRTFALPEQIVDGGRGGTVFHLAWVAKGLAKIAALGVGHEAE
jgi:hypothetical protein